MGWSKQEIKDKNDEEIVGRDEEVPRLIDYQYVHGIFQNQYHSLDKSQRDTLYQGNSLQILRFLLNEYTRSRLIHYDRLNSYLLEIPSISDIVKDAKKHGSLLNIFTLNEQDQVDIFDEQLNYLFSPVVAQSALFLINKLLKRPFNRTPPHRSQFHPVRNLLNEFVLKIDPQRKENLSMYYHPSNLKKIAIFLEKNPDLDITKFLPVFFENDEFVTRYSDWVDSIQNNSYVFDGRQEKKGDFDKNKASCNLLQDFLDIYIQELRIPTNIDKKISQFLPRIIHLDLIREIISFYKESLPKCFHHDDFMQSEVMGGINAFECILEKSYGQNFVTMGYYEYYNLLKRSSVPEEMIDCWIFDLEKKNSYTGMYDRFWKQPFLKYKKSGKNARMEICFSYVQVLDAFFYFLSSTMKSCVMGSTRGRGFEEVVAQQIINKLGITPFKINIIDPEVSHDDEKLECLGRQSNLETPMGVKIQKAIIRIPGKDLDMDENFNFRDIDLAFVYERTLYVIECKNPLYNEFADFEPIVLKRNINVIQPSYEKRRICENPRVKYALNMLNLGIPPYDNVRFIIVTGEECPFDIMLSYLQFMRILRNFEKIHQLLEDTGRNYVSKNPFTEKFIFWNDEESATIAEKKLTSKGKKRNIIEIDVEFEDDIKKFNELME